MSGVVHTFEKSLAFANRPEHQEFWVEFYQQVWPDSKIIQVPGNFEMQRRGVDRIVMLQSGKQILIDEKVRDKDYGDILLETASSGKEERGTITVCLDGWAICNSKHCDYIAYAIPNIGKCYLLPFGLMRAAVLANMPKWHREGWRVRKAENKSYTTYNVAVTFDELSEEMKKQMMIQIPQTTTGEITQ